MNRIGIFTKLLKRSIKSTMYYGEMFWRLKEKKKKKSIGDKSRASDKCWLDKALASQLR